MARGSGRASPAPARGPWSKSSPRWRAEARELLERSKHLSSVWSEPLALVGGAEMALELSCRVCRGTVRIVGRALVPSGQGRDPAEGLTEKAKTDVRAFVAKHELCPVRAKKTGGVQQEFSELG